MIDEGVIHWMKNTITTPSNDGSYNNVLKVNGVAFGLTFDDQGSLYLTTNQKTVEKYKIPQ